MRGGQLYCQSYWHDLLKIIENGVNYHLIFMTLSDNNQLFSILGSRSNFYHYTYHGIITRFVAFILYVDISMLIVFLAAEAYKMFDEKSDGTM
jgi:hypothetical protein